MATKARLHWFWQILIASVILIVGAWWLFIRVPPRPMFHDLYAGPHGDTGFPRSWKMVWPVEDARGNLLYADPDLNLLVVFVVEGRRGTLQIGGWNATPDETTLTVGAGADSLSILVPRQSNMAIFVRPDGKQIPAALPEYDADTAGKIRRAVESDASVDGLQLLAQQEHVSKEMREIIQSFLPSPLTAPATGSAVSGEE